EIHRLAGREFAIRSRDQLEAVLYDELGLASGKKTKLTGKRSTAVSALEPLRNEHPIIPALLEYRELEKLRGTYLDPLPNLVNPRTGRLHTTFSQTTAATGRLSSLNPNLQNIPIRSELGREIRKGFIADEGYCLISADYSQIELRLLAAIADDPLMQQAFREGADIHRRTAAQVLGLAEDAITPNQRRAAKTVNFGVLYGMSAHRLSNELSIPYAEAAQFIDVYFSTYPGIRRYIERTLDFGREHGYVETLYGRRRYVPELKSQNRAIREAGERLAYNMPIQGTAADIIKIAMVRLAGELEALGARLLLQVHDELLIEAPLAQADQVAALTREVMENAAHLSVPLAVEVGIGPNWYDTK
ncbi:MAG: DNA polymerase, partial [Deinococcota bacterium]